MSIPDTSICSDMLCMEVLNDQRGTVVRDQIQLQWIQGGIKILNIIFWSLNIYLEVISKKLLIRKY